MWNRILHRLRLARGLSFSDWFSLIEAWWALVVFYFALRLMSLERLSAARDSKLENAPALTEARRLHRLVGWAARLHLLPMTCLVQSLTLRWMLMRRGIASRLRIGASKDLRGFRAHAWLEMDGEKIGESEDVDGIFRVLTRRTLP